MQAMVAWRYGSSEVLQLGEMDKPSPKANEMLIRVRASSVNAAEWRILRGEPFFLRFTTGLFKRKNPVLGIDMAGQIEAIGSKVTQFKPGDEVYGDLFHSGMGAFAEYACAAETDTLVRKPANMSFGQAAAVPVAGITALQALRYKGEVKPGDRVLVNGASGEMGSFAVQLAKALGAEVTAVGSTGKMDYLRLLGADHVIDYTLEDFTKNGRHYDLILGVNGYHPLADYKRALSPRGRYVGVGGTGKQIFQDLVLASRYSEKGGRQLGSMGMAQANKPDLEYLRELMESGRFTPVIERTYPLAQVPEAIRYVESGHARGKVVIRI